MLQGRGSCLLMLESHAETRVLNDFTDLVLVTLLLNLEPMFRENNIHNSLILSLCAINEIFVCHGM